MVLKTVIMLMAYFIPLITINLGLVSNIYGLFVLYLTSGFGMAGIGTPDGYNHKFLPKKQVVFLVDRRFKLSNRAPSLARYMSYPL